MSFPRRDALLASMLFVAACGRVGFRAVDAGSDGREMDAPSAGDAAAPHDAPGDAHRRDDAGRDASSIDAAGIDAFAIDAFGVDARGTDAGAPDTSPPDASPTDAGRTDAPAAADAPTESDAGSTPCRASIQWYDGAGTDQWNGVAAGPGDTLFLQGSLSVPGFFPGWPAGPAVGRLNGARVAWVRSFTTEVIAFDGSDVIVLRRDGLNRLDGATGTSSDLGAFVPTVSNAASVAPDGAGGAVFGVTSHLGAVSFGGTDLGAAMDDVAIGFVDAAGALGPFWALAGPDNDVIHDAVRVGSEVVFIGGGNVTPICIGATCTSESSFAVRVSRTAPPRFEEALGDAYRVTADSAGNVYGSGFQISSIAPDGTRRWLHAQSPAFADAVVDEARSRLWVAGRVLIPLTYGASTVTLLGPGETLGVLAFDAASGALVDALTFGGVGENIYPTGIALAADGTVIVVGHTRATFAACPGEVRPPAASLDAAFILRIAPEP